MKNVLVLALLALAACTGSVEGDVDESAPTATCEEDCEDKAPAPAKTGVGTSIVSNDLGPDNTQKKPR